ncbi:hypothetical protein BDW66DRAFT_167605 [Aspergillus desertorum]
MPITKSMVQKARREQAAAEAQAAAQKAISSRKRQREADDTAEREEELAQKRVRETRPQTRKRQLQEPDHRPSEQATPPKRRRTAQRSKASRRRTAPFSSEAATRPQSAARTAKPKPIKAAPSTSERVTRSTTRDHGGSLQREHIEDPEPKEKGKAPIYPPRYYETRSRSLTSLPTSSSQQPVQGNFGVSAASSQAASLLPQSHGQDAPATSSYELLVTRSSTCVSTELETGTINATIGAASEDSQYVPGSDSGSSEATRIQSSAASDVTAIQPNAASGATITPATRSRRRNTTWKDRATLRKEAQKKAKDALKANTGYGVGTKTTAFLHWIPVPSDREYLHKIESALWRRNSLKGERGKGRGYRDAWWWHFADHYKIQAENVSCELDYSELMRASAEASVFCDKPGLVKMGVPICDRCFFMGRACRTDQVNACINCVKAFQPCTITERKHPFTRRQFVGQRWINHGFDINFNVIKKRTEEPHRLFCDWESVPLPPPPKAGELVYLRGRSLERPIANRPKAVPRLPFDRAYQVPDRVYEKYNLHEVDWPWPLPDPFPETDQEPPGETAEEHQRRLVAKADAEEKRVKYNRRQQERRQRIQNGELQATRRKGVYSIEWQKARQKKMMADYHQRTKQLKKPKRSTRGRSRTQSRVVSSMEEVKPEKQLEQQAEQQLQNELEQQTEQENTIQGHLEQQGSSRSQAEASIQHENDIQMGDLIRQSTTDDGNEDQLMADASNAMPLHPDIPVDPALERMRFNNRLPGAQPSTNTRSGAGLQTALCERIEAAGNIEGQSPASNGRRPRARTKTMGGQKQKTRADTNNTKSTDEPMSEASQSGANTVTGPGGQILPQTAGVTPDKAPTNSTTPDVLPSPAQASWDIPYPDPPVQGTDSFGYYAIAGVGVSPEDLFGHSVVPNRSAHRPPQETHNEWCIPNPNADPVPPVSPVGNAQHHSNGQNEGCSEDVEMGGV